MRKSLLELTRNICQLTAAYENFESTSTTCDIEITHREPVLFCILVFFSIDSSEDNIMKRRA